MARPPKTTEERRSEQVKIRLTLAEHLQLAEQADLADMSVAEFVRRRSLGYTVQPPAPRADQQLLSEVNRIGVNLNQLTRAVNSGAEFHGRQAVLRKFELLEEEVTQMLVRVSEVL